MNFIRANTVELEIKKCEWTHIVKNANCLWGSTDVAKEVPIKKKNRFVYLPNDIELPLLRQFKAWVRNVK